ncbi:MAG: DUF6445 family protein [Hyphomonadaceae bacterium]
MDDLQHNYKIVRFGNEEEPIVIIDDFSGQLDELMEKAANCHYEPALGGYPGHRAPADVNYLAGRGKLLTEIFYQVFGFDRGGHTESCTFSMVTTQRTALSVHQCMPHFDDTGPDLLALLHYLKGPETGGTSFYRQRRTGFETVTPDRLTEYKTALTTDMKTHGAPAQDYICGSDKRYELIGTVDARPDRMIIYRGRTLHSGAIPPGFPISPDPRHARLSLNTFLTRLH